MASERWRVVSDVDRSRSLGQYFSSQHGLRLTNGRLWSRWQGETTRKSIFLQLHQCVASLCSFSNLRKQIFCPSFMITFNWYSVHLLISKPPYPGCRGAGIWRSQKPGSQTLSISVWKFIFVFGLRWKTHERIRRLYALSLVARKGVKTNRETHGSHATRQRR